MNCLLFSDVWRKLSSECATFKSTTSDTVTSLIVNSHLKIFINHKSHSFHDIKVLLNRLHNVRKHVKQIFWICSFRPIFSVTVTFYLAITIQFKVSSVNNFLYSIYIKDIFLKILATKIRSKMKLLILSVNCVFNYYCSFAIKNVCFNKLILYQLSLYSYCYVYREFT